MRNINKVANRTPSSKILQEKKRLAELKNEQAKASSKK